MEFMPYCTPTSFCCLIVSKTKNDMAILQQEIERISVLEDECNKKLDEFYASKQEFEFMLRNLSHKMLGNEIDYYPKEKEIIEEFADYVMAAWQFGADRLGQAQKKLYYISIVDGLPLSVYTQVMQNTLEKGSMSIAQTVCHPSCTSLFYSMYTEECGDGRQLINRIFNELQHNEDYRLLKKTTHIHSTHIIYITWDKEVAYNYLQGEGITTVIHGITNDFFVRLSTADICFRQYEYLKKSLPFLTKLKDFIKKYTDNETIQSIKLFSDDIISGISLKSLGDENYDDKENLGAFRNVVNLLTGQLFGCDDILDPHTEIIPVVCDILNQRPGKKAIVRRLVEFYLKDEIEILSNMNDKDNKINLNKIDNNNTNIKSNLNNFYPLSLMENDQYNQIIDPTFLFTNTSDQIFDVNGMLYQISDNSGNYFDSTLAACDPFQQYCQPYLNQTSPGTYLTMNDIHNLIPRYYEPQGKTNKYNTTPGKRGRKAGSTLDHSLDINCDLKPIKIPKLKQDLIKPLT